MNLSLDSSLTIAPDVVFRELGDEAVLLNLKTGTYFGLDRVGASMWRLIVQHGSLASVLGALLDEYDVERETLERDLLDLCDRLCVNGLAEDHRSRSARMA